MLTLGQVVSAPRSENADLPLVPELGSLHELWTPKRGQYIMIGARSGAGKSTFARFYAERSGLHVLYYSADTSAQDTLSCVVALHLGCSMDEADQVVQEEGLSDELVEKMRASNVSYAFGELTWEALDLELDAYVAMHNRNPDLLIIDNLANMDGASSDFHAQVEVSKQFLKLTRTAEIAVWALHHCSENVDPKEMYERCPAKREITNKLSGFPETILTVRGDAANRLMHVAVVKQRRGEADETGWTYRTLGCDYSSGKIEKLGFR